MGGRFFKCNFIQKCQVFGTEILLKVYKSQNCASEVLQVSELRQKCYKANEISVWGDNLRGGGAGEN